MRLISAVGGLLFNLFGTFWHSVLVFAAFVDLSCPLTERKFAACRVTDDDL